MKKDYLAESLISCVEILKDAQMLSGAEARRLTRMVKDGDEKTYKKISKCLEKLAKRGRELNK